MREYLDVLAGCPLFDGVERADITAMLGCLDGRAVEVRKGEAVFNEGDPARFMGIVLAGSVQILRDDYYGNRSVLTVVGPGGLFAEAFACAGLERMPVSAVAQLPGAVLLMDCRRVLRSCSNACPFHSRMVDNLLRGIAQKNLTLTQKIRYMSQKTTRDKLMEVLLDQAKAHHSAEFTIPFDRQSLADYLGVERSALSAEISRMRRDGLIESTGSRFRLLKTESER